ncbi:MAG: ABC transporter permease subunit [Pirellula sp.]|nr:ABC transporter permease subunit [Pirellula sp.]
MTNSRQPLSNEIASKRPVRKQLWFDTIARALITSGGIGTILVALLIVFVMISQLLPLLSTSDATTVAEFTIDHDSNAPTGSDSPNRQLTSEPICAGMDEYGDIAWFLFPSGSIQTYSTRSGLRLQSFAPPADALKQENANPSKPEITACSVADDDASLLVGYSNGYVRPITIRWNIEYLDQPNEESDDHPSPDSDEPETSVMTELPNGLVRVQRIDSIDFHDPIAALKSPVRCIDWLKPDAIYGLEKAKSWKWLASDGNEVIVQHHLRRRLGISLANTEEIKTWRTSVPSNSIIAAMLNAQGETFTSITSDGLAQLWRLSPETSIGHLASHWTITGSESKVLSAVPILGRNTLLMSSESGYLEGVSPYFGPDKSDLVSIHRMSLPTQRIRQLSPATNSRVVAALMDDGVASLIYVPTNRQLLRWTVDPESKIFFSSGSRFMGALHGNSVTVARLNLRFPEAGWQSFLNANWFEGYDSPRHLWQSSSGTIQGEIKLSIVPLVFGTIKATFYTLLIAIPLGLISAIFSSEYLHPTSRARIKPIMELMASVPSVALGFVGAIALAPLVRDNLFGLFLFLVVAMLILVSIPAILSTLPRSAAASTTKHRAWTLILVLIAALGISRYCAERMEFGLFGGPLTYWLNGEFGSAFPGWLCIAILPCGVLTFWAFNHFQISRFLTKRLPFLRPDSSFNLLAMHALQLIASVVITCALSACLSLVGWDARGTLLDSYQERNALLVGVVLGFAIVPLIFTLSEDALQAVPQHLRAASMSCGATVWQTTIRVVVPTAVSGLFSAVMLGLGRAIGETMVVLMVSGNSAIMELNPFSGFRTLSATLAMELPEAARGSTHYHSLFFVSLVLFFLTVVVNSIAEFVRLKFKRNASQL